MQGVRGGLRRGEQHSTGYARRRSTPSTLGPERSDPQCDQALQGRKWPGLLLCKTPVHALSGSGLRRGLSIPGAAQGSGERDRELEGGGVHWLSLLHDHLPLSHTAIPVERLQSTGDKVRIVQRPSATRIKARMHNCLPDGCSDLWAALSTAAGSEAEDREQPRSLLPEPRVR